MILKEKKSGNIELDASIWNLAATMFDAIQSPLFLLVITWNLNLQMAGIFSIGYSLATQLLIVGKYNVRNYQVTDYKNKYLFGDYLYNRIVTTFLMICFLLIYIFYGITSKGYGSDKVLIILLLVTTKVVDSIEDVYGGMYQYNGRLDIAARNMFLRLATYIFINIFLLCITKSLLFSLLVSGCLSLIVCILQIKFSNKKFNYIIGKPNFLKIGKIALDCFPLFLGSFCSIYTINSPKYAMDGVVPENIQAIYGFISLPATLVFIVTSAIFQSQVVHMSVSWGQKKYVHFNKIVIKQVLLLLLFSVFAFTFCYFLGIPILSLMYQTDLTMYHTQFMQILLGGICLGISALFSTVLTVIRKQAYVLCGYGLIAIIAKIAFPIAANQAGINGCSALYFMLMCIEMCFFGILLFWGEKKQIQKL